MHQGQNPVATYSDRPRTAQETPPRTLVVVDAANRLINSAQSLKSTVEALEVRLESVTRLPPPQTSGIDKACQSAACPLEGQLRVAGDSIDDQVVRLMSILDRLEV